MGSCTRSLAFSNPMKFRHKVAWTAVTAVAAGAAFVVVDPWGSAWSIACAGEGVIVSSSGPDGIPLTADDVRMETRPN